MGVLRAGRKIAISLTLKYDPWDDCVRHIHRILHSDALKACFHSHLDEQLERTERHRVVFKAPRGPHAYLRQAQFTYLSGGLARRKQSTYLQHHLRLHLTRAPSNGGRADADLHKVGSVPVKGGNEE